MKKWLKVIPVLAVLLGSMALAKWANVTASTTTSLLHGCTVSATNTINFGSGGCPSALPSGWTLITCEGFEGGKLHTTCDGKPISSLRLAFGTSVSCIKGHTGSCSATGLVNAQGGGPSLYSNNSSFGTVYISYWEWKDSNASMNDELFIADMRKSVNGTLEQRILTERFNYGGFNSPFATIVIQPQGNHYGNIWGPVVAFGAGTWYQWEVLYHPNTLGKLDGMMQVYLNGTTLINKSGVNLNGTINMLNSAIQIGGNYGKSVWTNNGERPNAGGTCSTKPTGKEAGFWIGAFNANPINPGNCSPAPPRFNLNQDDVIITAK
jgi:hypothetical protein